MVSCYVQAGDSADLVCSYYLDSHQLYSVKWYKVSILYWNTRCIKCNT